MSFNLNDVNVGGQLKVGSGVVPAVGEGDKRVNGSVYAELFRWEIRSIWIKHSDFDGWQNNQ